VTIDKILVPVDFSPSSISAAHLGARLAAAHRAQLTLTHVLIPASPGLVVVEPVAVPPVLGARMEASQVAAAKRKLTELADELGLGANIVLRYGATVEELLEAAAEVDLVVVGTEGRDLIPNHVAVELARRGEIPVLACPADGDRDFARVVIAIDFTPDSLDFAATAANLVGDAGLVEVMHVHPTATLDVEGANRDARWLEAIAARTPTRATVRSYIGHGQLGLALLARAGEIDADLIAIGVEPADADRRLGLAEKLVAATPLPLLLVPTPPAPVA
jgi:nucleotide-binding universal stress UspA family protein